VKFAYKTHTLQSRNVEADSEVGWLDRVPTKAKLEKKNRSEVEQLSV